MQTIASSLNGLHSLVEKLGKDVKDNRRILKELQDVLRLRDQRTTEKLDGITIAVVVKYKRIVEFPIRCPEELMDLNERVKKGTEEFKEELVSYGFTM